MKKTVFLSVCLTLALGAPLAAKSGDKSGPRPADQNTTGRSPAGSALTGGVPSGRILLLHYQWRHDSIALVDKQWVPAAVKARRGRAAANPQTGMADVEAPRTPFSYELLSADGKRISVGYLRDPGLESVEIQEKGEHQIQSHERKVDSADIFLRVSEPEAKTIRFYRHARPNAHAPDTTIPGAATASGAAKKAGPEPAPAKTLLAEFPLD